ncbi:MAG: hypothetical protein JWQ03_2354 [Variovorax sp.]|nr:hypothetical protein [Variovorax sp.]
MDPLPTRSTEAGMPAQPLTPQGLVTVLAEKTGVIAPGASLTPELRAFVDEIVGLCASVAGESSSAAEAGERIRARLRG